MKGITITSITSLLALSLAAYDPSWIGGRQGKTDSAGGLNAVQDDKRPATGAQDVKQPVKNIKQRGKAVKQRIADPQDAKKPAKDAKQQCKDLKCSMTDTRQDVIQPVEEVKRQVIYTQVFEQPGGELRRQVIYTQDFEQPDKVVKQPAKDIRRQTVYRRHERCQAPASWRGINPISHECQRCPTAYGGRLEPGVQ